MSRKGLMPLWATAIFGAIFLLLGLYLAIAFFTIPVVFWIGVALFVIGMGMIFVSSVLSQ